MRGVTVKLIKVPEHPVGSPNWYVSIGDIGVVTHASARHKVIAVQFERTNVTMWVAPEHIQVLTE